MKAKITLWIAQGFGVGRIPFAPGTFGSLVGFLPVALLLVPENFWLYLAGVIAFLLLAVPVCGNAEIILDQKDPGSVVLDEIVAIPLCFVSWIALVYFRDGAVPSLSFILIRNWPLALTVFALFRLFDIWKPWPVRQSQSLPNGWGVVVDDLLAAGYVNVFMLGMALLFSR